MRQAGVYVLAAAQKMAGSSSVSSIVDPLIVNASKIVDTHYDYLSSRVDVLKDLIEWEPLPVLLKNIYAHHDASAQSAAGALLRAAVSNDANGVDLVNVAAAIDRNESSHASFKKLTDRVKLLKDLPEYRELKLDELGREVLDFLELRTATPLEKATVSDLFKFVAMPLENGDVHELVRLAARKPKDVERGVRGFAMTIGAGGMDRFFGVVGRYFRPKTGSPL
jgi:hypothetical protein